MRCRTSIIRSSTLVRAPLESSWAMTRPRRWLWTSSYPKTYVRPSSGRFYQPLHAYCLTIASTYTKTLDLGLSKFLNETKMNNVKRISEWDMRRLQGNVARKRHKGREIRETRVCRARVGMRRQTGKASANSVYLMTWESLGSGQELGDSPLIWCRWSSLLSALTFTHLVELAQGIWYSISKMLSPCLICDCHQQLNTHTKRSFEKNKNVTQLLGQSRFPVMVT